MSLVEQLHQERKARLARMNPVFREPPMRPMMPAPLVRPVQAKTIRDDAFDERIWNELICGCDLVEQPPTQVSIRIADIKMVVATYYGISIADMDSQRRTLSLTRPRQVTMYLAKLLTPRSLPQIGIALGNRDHTTVLHGVRKVAAEILRSKEMSAEIETLAKIIRGLP